DLVVTNHALLAIDAFDAHGIIPEHDVVVFDEAHDLTARVTSAVTETLTPGMVRGTLRDLRGLGMAATALDDAGEELREALALAPRPPSCASTPAPAIPTPRTPATTARPARRAPARRSGRACRRSSTCASGSVPPPRTTWSRSPIPRPRDAPSSRSRRSAWPGPCAGRSWRIAPPC